MEKPSRWSLTLGLNYEGQGSPGTAVGEGGLRAEPGLETPALARTCTAHRARSHGFGPCCRRRGRVSVSATSPGRLLGSRKGSSLAPRLPPGDPPHRAAPLVFCTCSHVRRELPESADGATGPAPLPLRSCQSHPAKGWACDPGLDNWRAPSSGHSDWFKVAQTWPSSFL